MKQYLVGILCFCLSTGVLAQDHIRNSAKTIHPGEVLTYKVTYGFIPVGEAKIETSQTVHTLNNTPCYKVDITGKTTGAVGLVARVDDKWGAYLNVQNLLPVKSYRIIRENNYKRDEMSFFDHVNKTIRYQRYDYAAARFKDPLNFSFEGTIRDLVGGYQHLRQLDYAHLQTGDTLSLYGFFEDDFFNFKILFMGRETIKTAFGKVQALKLVPVMPNNKVFDGENSITIWLSDDANKIPLKIEANMFVGKAGCEIISHQNLKSPLLVSSKK